jgi:uncharacterized tellurite resistance protein B-like protein
MSGILNKITDQLSGQKQTNTPSSGSSAILHKVTDAVTGQKHPQESTNCIQ